MSLLLFLSIGCSNFQTPDWQGSGARYASGRASDESDTGGGDDTAGSGSAPDLTTGAAAYEANDLEQIYIQAGVAYDDEPDDVEGGTLYYTLYADGDQIEQGTRLCVEDDDLDLNTEALLANDIINFSVGPVDVGPIHQLEVYVVDYTHNESNMVTITVTGE